MTTIPLKRYQELMSQMFENLQHLEKWGVPFEPTEIGFERERHENLEYELEELAEQMAACRECPLASDRVRRRAKCVPGGGNPDAIVMIVGEGPGKQEEKYQGPEAPPEYGFPFVGASGQVLNEIIKMLGLKRKDLFISNVVHCLHPLTSVYLPDGTLTYISKLYKDNYRGNVLSYDTDTNTFVPKKVKNVIKSPLGDRQWLKVTYEGAKTCGNKGPAGAVVTNDHEFLTRNNEWVAAEQLQGREINIGPHGMNSTAKQVAIGTLLGDAHIPHPQAIIQMGHQPSQKEWLVSKSRCLNSSELIPLRRVRVTAPSGTYEQYRSRTHANRYIAYLRQEFYDGTHKKSKGAQKTVPSWLAKEFTPLMAAVWFCDDGYTRITPKNCYDECEIATCGFPDSSIEKLVECLDSLGVTGSITKDKRISFSRNESHKLLATISQYVPPCMRYKLGKHEPTFNPFEPATYEPKPIEPHFAKAIVYPIAKRERQCYCLEVEDTHNFLTPAGVVHNCRASEIDERTRKMKDRFPSNREIEACLHFVRKQIELVQPWLIIATGKGAGTTLLDLPTHTRITDIKDKLYDYPKDPRIKIWPTFHPANLLYNPTERVGTGLWLRHLRAIIARAKTRLEND